MEADNKYFKIITTFWNEHEAGNGIDVTLDLFYNLSESKQAECKRYIGELIYTGPDKAIVNIFFSSL